MNKAPRDDFQRARSQAEKLDRRQSILDAAQAFVTKTGVDQFSMNGLAAQAGVAKGTLYLYFATKEELLLALYLSRLSEWSQTLRKATQKGMSENAFCEAFLAAADADPLFMDLSAQLSSVIEKNVSIDRFSEAKRSMLELMVPLSAHLEVSLNLRPGEGPGLLTGLMALLLGAEQFDSGGIHPTEALPEDVAAIVCSLRKDDVFLRFAPLILHSVKAD